jgi:nitrite reductase/ring-hydroxylating ferredoxin subunit
MSAEKKKIVYYASMRARYNMLRFYARQAYKMLAIEDVCAHKKRA